MIIRKSLQRVLPAAALFVLAACTQPGDMATKTANEAPSFSPERIKADVTFLADDTLEGRDTGSKGYRIAANYVAAEYRRLGLTPAGDNDTFFQEVPFKTAQLKQDTAEMTVTIAGQQRDLALGDDFFVSGAVEMPNGNISGDLVFAGFGIHAPDLNHDDLADLDVAGKIVVLVSGAPKNFNTEIRAHHGSSTTKKKELAKRGALGTIFITTASAEKRRPFERMKNYLDYKDFDWVRPSDSDTGAQTVQVSASVSPDVARSLFEGAERSYDAVILEAEDGAPKGFSLNGSATMKMDSDLSETFFSPNVLAVLEGSDPALKGEYVVMSAHLDHIGISDHAEGDDKINNGALDNASGVAVMMEVARAYARAGVKPKRSILFAAVVAEEKGLLGAEYFAHFPTVEKSAMVANVNLDMPILLYDFTDIVAFGAERSSLGEVTRQAASKIGLTLSPDPMPPEGIFTRSDHYRFVQQGIPSVFLVTGWGPSVDNRDGGAIFREFLGKTYHKPHDDLSQPIDYEAGAKFAYVNWLIVNEIANAATRPSWNEGDFFGNTFGR